MSYLLRLQAVLLTSLLVLCFSCLSATTGFAAPPSNSNQFTILFSNNMAGDYKPCGWKSNKLGGLSGKASLVEHERITAGESLLLLDSGKSLFKRKNNKKPRTLIEARGIAKAYMLMGYDAVALSASDIMHGDLFLEDTLQDGFPWISANVVDQTGQPVTKPYILKTINSLKIAIIGLTDMLAADNQYSTIEYTAPLTTLLKQLTGKSEMIILLSNLQPDVNLIIAKQFPEIDIIFSSDRSLGKMAPKIINNSLITQTSNRGKYLGKLDVEWNSGNAWYNDRPPLLSQLIKRRTLIESELIKLEKNTAKSNKKKVPRLRLQQQQLEKQIESRKVQEGDNSGRPNNKYRISFAPVQPTKTPQSIESIVEDIDGNINGQTTTN